MLAPQAETTIRYDEDLVKAIFYHDLETGFLSQAVRNHMHLFLILLEELLILNWYRKFIGFLLKIKKCVQSSEPDYTILLLGRVRNVGTECWNNAKRNFGARLQSCKPGDTVLFPRRVLHAGTSNVSSKPVSISICWETVITEQPRVIVRKNIIQTPLHAVSRNGSILE